jgi:hypothetical protein
VRSVIFRRVKTSIFALLLVVLVSFFALELIPAASEGRSVNLKANDFLNTLGAGTHLNSRAGNSGGDHRRAEIYGYPQHP